MCTFAVFKCGVFVGTEEGPFEEVEGEYEKKGGSDPIASHQHEQSFLVDAERPCFFSEFPKGAEGGLVFGFVIVQAFCSYQILLHLVVYYISWNWKGRRSIISVIH